MANDFFTRDVVQVQRYSTQSKPYFRGPRLPLEPSLDERLLEYARSMGPSERPSAQTITSINEFYGDVFGSDAAEIIFLEMMKGYKEGNRFLDRKMISLGEAAKIPVLDQIVSYIRHLDQSVLTKGRFTLANDARVPENIRLDLVARYGSPSKNLQGSYLPIIQQFYEARVIPAQARRGKLHVVNG